MFNVYYQSLSVAHDMTASFGSIITIDNSMKILHHDNYDKNYHVYHYHGIVEMCSKF